MPSVCGVFRSLRGTVNSAGQPLAGLVLKKKVRSYPGRKRGGKTRDLYFMEWDWKLKDFTGWPQRTENEK